MDLQNALTELEELAKKLNVDLVYDHFTGDGMGPGGMCKIKGRWRIIIERRCSPSEKISILINSLRRFDLDAHFLSPGVRQLVARVTGAAAAEPAVEEEQTACPAQPTAAEQLVDEQPSAEEEQPATEEQLAGEPPGEQQQ